MRCSKCHYLSFDPEPRCRNCGFELSLDDGDLFVRESDTPSSPFADLNLHPAPPPAVPVPESFSAIRREGRETARSAAAVLDVEESATMRKGPGRGPGETAARLESPRPLPRPAPTTELPLFVKGLPASQAPPGPRNESLVRLPAEARAPLAVRRAVPEPPATTAGPVRSSPPARSGPLDRDLLDVDRIEAVPPSERPVPTRLPAPPVAAMPAVGVVKRLGAAVVDAGLMGGLCAAVVWATLRWSNLPLERALVLPIVAPTLTFLGLLAVGYLVMFTAAGGQTIGKMALGIRVIGDLASPGADGVVTLGQAVYRACLTIPSVAVLGAGFLPALTGDERAVHDRLARTRVVRA
jgi:uncharacterized RDD family membrane protein YckC